MEDAFEKTMNRFRRLDVVCNNAGISESPDFKSVVDIDLTAVIRGTRLAKKYMDKNTGGNGGVIINVSSMAGILYIPYSPVYAAAKHGVIGYSKSLASPGADPAYAVDNIRVNVVCPSFTETPIIRKAVPHLSPKEFEAYKASLEFVPFSDVITAYMRLVEEDLHGEAIRITPQKGIDFHKFRKQVKFIPNKL